MVAKQALLHISQTLRLSDCLKIIEHSQEFIADVDKSSTMFNLFWDVSSTPFIETIGISCSESPNVLIRRMEGSAIRKLEPTEVALQDVLRLLRWSWWSVCFFLGSDPTRVYNNNNNNNYYYYQIQRLVSLLLVRLDLTNICCAPILLSLLTSSTFASFLGSFLQVRISRSKVSLLGGRIVKYDEIA